MSAKKRRVKRKIAMVLRLGRQYLLTGGDNTSIGLTHRARMQALTTRIKHMGYAQRAIDAMNAQRHALGRHW